jgi:hypothetical protein
MAVALAMEAHGAGLLWSSAPPRGAGLPADAVVRPRLDAASPDASAGALLRFILGARTGPRAYAASMDVPIDAMTGRRA